MLRRPNRVHGTSTLLRNENQILTLPYFEMNNLRFSAERVINPSRLPMPASGGYIHSRSPANSLPAINQSTIAQIELTLPHCCHSNPVDLN
ncbi:hypothetical protein DSO57_1007314 [Entomophthora muscae]|uniref:Uncharacterized protein n=1 Tax=Entomophthora muscae TaxID=34485 RepID=A0ACC2RM25_9FUNG|nr:hypothetical protein DSO57_1007314 [Entomophthora muscae]